MRKANITRRTVLRGAVATGAAAALGGGKLQSSLAAKRAPAVIQGGGRLTYWGGLIFSQEANDLLVQTINDWGAENGVETEVVMINQNETVQRVSAAVESGTMPDALDMGLDLTLLLAQNEQLVAVDDVYERIGEAQGGWFDSIAESTRPELFGGARTGVPFGASGNILFRRRDVLEDAGFTEAPATWQEVADQAREAQAPPLFGLGFALSNVGDGNTMMSIMQSYGGRIADDEGREVQIRSEETRTFLEWVVAAWEDGLFPPGVTTWDGAGDNQAYLAGQAVFIMNTGSVHLAAREEDPDLDAATSYSALPAGPEGIVSPLNPNVRVIPTTTEDVDQAKALIEHLANPTFLEQYYNVAIYGPVLANQREFPVFSEEVHGALADLAEFGTAPAQPDLFNPAYAEVSANFLIPKMIQRIVIDGYSLDEAMEEAHTAAADIYSRRQ